MFKGSDNTPKGCAHIALRFKRSAFVAQAFSLLHPTQLCDCPNVQGIGQHPKRGGAFWAQTFQPVALISSPGCLAGCVLRYSITRRSPRGLTVVTEYMRFHRSPTRLPARRLAAKLLPPLSSCASRPRSKRGGVR